MSLSFPKVLFPTGCTNILGGDCMPAGNIKNMNIDQYNIHHLIAPNPSSNSLIRIMCSSGAPSASLLVGEIAFYPKGLVPASKMYLNRFILNYEIDRYLEIIDTLRYEKPVYVSVNWDANYIIYNGMVTTSTEPIGEQEGQGAPPA